ncbi:hypothetical protein KL930_003377 [Ogataea haglerorum]|uniref:Alpha/beta hydrolase fold-3 domain-containing protein n=1 Tax=Ogataea haglerorum TaxID=1937702 RepID=A0AAN6D1M2_9ASCO|nr:uncharacterized protein KL911_002373 [Ogataea haglerorum]KAG7696351.1 hypothetical protein KL915_002715 [Ogataea haglerorum]KAG7696723.1 hypothetical protein KL951_003179 [Ogataea haglerorum]KAG7706832.1 hypothetical protein KL914_002716 [Ogataea haglerorum]KAG7708860.1 hypothetical protein KL950_002380 [Ogataea haglerorum]KAG7716355.1 hypothetical protein KL913_003566 [Ogataea haglerorum]
MSSNYTFGNTNKVHRQGTLNHYVLLKVVKHFLPEITDENNPSYSLVANPVWKRFYDYRSVVQAWNGIERSFYEEVKENNLKGNWIKKVQCQNETPLEPDLVIYYIPNILILSSTPHFYSEYLTTLHSLLLLQGFKNPLIFVPQLKNVHKCELSDHLFTVIQNWQEITTRYKNAKWIIAGDSAGASLALSFLLFRIEPDYNIFKKEAECIEGNEDIEHKFQEINKPINKPFGVLLISPLLKYKGISKRISEDICPDFLTTDFINRISQRFIPSHLPELSIIHSPGFCNNPNTWEKCFPEKGIILTWGAEELLRDEIEDFGNTLAMAGSTKLWKMKGGIHSWPFASFLTEEAQDEKEDSCFVLAGVISRMTLWHTTYYLDPEKSNEPMNLLTIDDNHL